MIELNSGSQRLKNSVLYYAKQTNKKKNGGQFTSY